MCAKQCCWDGCCLKAGKTGYPFIDALMRQLKQTGRWEELYDPFHSSCWVAIFKAYRSGLEDSELSARRGTKKRTEERERLSRTEKYHGRNGIRVLLPVEFLQDPPNNFSQTEWRLGDSSLIIYNRLVAWEGGIIV